MCCKRMACGHGATAARCPQAHAELWSLLTFLERDTRHNIHSHPVCHENKQEQDVPALAILHHALCEVLQGAMLIHYHLLLRKLPLWARSKPLALLSTAAPPSHGPCPCRSTPSCLHRVILLIVSRILALLGLLTPLGQRICLTLLHKLLSYKHGARISKNTSTYQIELSCDINLQAVAQLADHRPLQCTCSALLL